MDEPFVVLPLADSVRRRVQARLEAVHERMGVLDPDPLAFLAAAPVDRPSDPGVLRLLPDAYGRPDEQDPLDRLASDQRRAFTDGDLRARKVSDSEHVQGQLLQDADEIELSERDVEIWVRALNDARLLLAADLGITDDVTPRDLAKRAMRPPGRAGDAAETLGALLDYEQMMMIQGALLDAVDPGMTEAVYQLVQNRPWD